MKVAYIAAGAAGMYCGTCLHDNSLAGALQKMGHDVALIPTYTPLRTDAADVSMDRVFLGAVNVYLQQKSSLFRRVPQAIARLLDRPGLIRRVAKLGASTDPTGLGAMTHSILLGEDGFQAQELEKLVAWLRDDFRPDLIHLTNSMFAGFARTLKREVKAPVLCALQGEDLFLDQLREPWKSRVFETLRERARDVDGFLVNTRYYAGLMTEILRVDPGKMHVVPLGLPLDGHEGMPGEGRTGGPLTVGYLARLCPEKGLGEIVEAFHLLATDPRWKGRWKGKIRLRVAGYLGERDRPFVEGLEAKIRKWGWADAYERVGEVDRDAKIAFLRSLDVLSVPTVYREPKGLFVLEALANGVPAVQPRHGAFPEVIEATGGGLLVEPGSPQALAGGIAELLGDREKRLELGRRGREAVHARFNDRVEAESVLALYESMAAGAGQARRASA